MKTIQEINNALETLDEKQLKALIAKCQTKIEDMKVSEDSLDSDELIPKLVKASKEINEVLETTYEIKVNKEMMVTLICANNGKFYYDYTLRNSYLSNEEVKKASPDLHKIRLDCRQKLKFLTSSVQKLSKKYNCSKSKIWNWIWKKGGVVFDIRNEI